MNFKAIPGGIRGGGPKEFPAELRKNTQWSSRDFSGKIPGGASEVLKRNLLKNSWKGVRKNSWTEFGVFSRGSLKEFLEEPSKNCSKGISREASKELLEELPRNS